VVTEVVVVEEGEEVVTAVDRRHLITGAQDIPALDLDHTRHAVSMRITGQIATKHT